MRKVYGSITSYRITLQRSHSRFTDIMYSRGYNIIETDNRQRQVSNSSSFHTSSSLPKQIDFSVNDVSFSRSRVGESTAGQVVDWTTNDVCFKQSAIRNRQPGYNRHQQMYSQAKPMYDQQQPTYTQRQPNVVQYNCGTNQNVSIYRGQDLYYDQTVYKGTVYYSPRQVTVQNIESNTEYYNASSEDISYAQQFSSSGSYQPERLNSYFYSTSEVNSCQPQLQTQQHLGLEQWIEGRSLLDVAKCLDRLNNQANTGYGSTVHSKTCSPAVAAAQQLAGEDSWDAELEMLVEQIISE